MRREADKHRRGVMIAKKTPLETGKEMTGFEKKKKKKKNERGRGKRKGSRAGVGGK